MQGSYKDKEGEEFWEEIHEVSTNFTLFLIFLHIVGVTMSSRLHNENLVKSMVTGKKNLNN
ncbi:cytochrome b/b6 domain-containing protein [Bathymodiolus thermophilus thioautotrophic gill symbiont]|uniref:cytochrome b/b6 domain-containing protein n=1 Tax=Bathymodiolus thermophilus thioautotrophic gill symbiont TaxID=2360 RepID=UPI000F08E907|nr:cytochrome b/b6 domain-containing protein [Bathymodiolus thermophilus thioautotrophic gill symbiont]